MCATIQSGCQDTEICHCPKLFTWCSGLLGNQQLNRPQLSMLQATKQILPTKPEEQCCYHLPSKAPVSSTSCPAPCCLNREYTTWMWRGDKPTRATSNLIMSQAKTSCRFDWPPLQLWWCPQTRTLQLLHSTSYNWNHNLPPNCSARNGPALLLRFINCLNSPETVNSECKTTKIKHFDALSVSILCLMFHLMRWHQMFWSVFSPYKCIIVGFPLKVFAASCD